jgi:hypothetical protein
MAANPTKVLFDVISVDYTLYDPYVQNLSHKTIRVLRLKSTTVHFPKVVGWYYSTFFHVRSKDVCDINIGWYL